MSLSNTDCRAVDIFNQDLIQIVLFFECLCIIDNQLNISYDFRRGLSGAKYIDQLTASFGDEFPSFATIKCCWPTKVVMLFQNQFEQVYSQCISHYMTFQNWLWGNSVLEERRTINSEITVTSFLTTNYIKYIKGVLFNLLLKCATFLKEMSKNSHRCSNKCPFQARVRPYRWFKSTY